MNVRTNPAKADKYRIYSVPTFVYVRDGEEVRRSTGYMSPERLKRMWAPPFRLF